jgi:hypothetical protein
MSLRASANPPSICARWSAVNRPASNGWRDEGERGFLTYDTDGRLHAPVETPADPRSVL